MFRDSASQGKWNSWTSTGVRVSGAPKLGRLAAALAAAACFTVGLAQAEPKPGDISKKFQINDADPMASVPSDAERDKNPIEFAHFLQDVIARAERALDKKDYATAAKYHEALAKMIPDRAISFSRLCVDYGRLNQPDKAAANCGKAIQLGGAKVIDHIRFVNFSLQKQEFTPEDTQAVEASLAHLRAYAAANPQPLPGTLPKQAAEPAETAVAAKPKLSKEEAIQAFAEKRQQRMLKEAEEKRTGHKPEKPAPLNPMHLPTEIETLNCKLASRLRDSDRLVQCIGGLRKYKASEVQTYPFEWAYAVLKKDSRRADALLARGKALGVPEDTLAAMASEQKSAIGTPVWVRWALAGVAFVVVGCAGFLGLRQLARRRPPASPPAAPPAAPVEA